MLLPWFLCDVSAAYCDSWYLQYSSFAVVVASEQAQTVQACKNLEVLTPSFCGQAQAAERKSLSLQTFRARELRTHECRDGDSKATKVPYNFEAYFESYSTRLKHTHGP